MSNIYYPMIKEETLVTLPHDYVAGFNGEHWCVWESLEDFRYGRFPYEAECIWKNGMAIAKKMLTKEDAIAFANKCHKSNVRKYGENYKVQ